MPQRKWGLKCDCGGVTAVLNTRYNDGQHKGLKYVSRRRICRICSTRFSTVEMRAEGKKGSPLIPDLQRKVQRKLAAALRILANQIDEGKL